ncbi:MAG: alpha-L-fucosidase, partial [Verrucomicrobia bacterium]|nr:alpha-L-fucosidase [Verrucomicrobiota bacterium]
PDPAREARLRWFHEAKYGLFINWGLYSIPAGEWKGKPIAGIGEWIMNRAKIPVREYEQLAQRFNPTKFDAEAWAQLAVDAGMKYVVFDCKHHDGFALYRSQVSPYNCYDATPWKRDPFKELQAACARRGLRLCFYYSQAQDWHDPNGAGNDWDFGPDAQKDFDRYLREKSLPQVRELLTGYGPIGLIWFDTPRLMTPARGKLFVDLVRSLQPDTVINSRLLVRGADLKNASLSPGQIAQAAEVGFDYISRGDNEIPHLVTPGAWETAATMNDTWGFKKDDHNWKTPEAICFKLVDIVSKGGNYLLNVGPDADGVIPAPSQEVLRTIGAWLKINGEAIYGAGRTPFGEELGTVLPGPKDKRGQPPFAPKKEWRCTTKPGKIYLHFFQWPGRRFTLRDVASKVARAYLLADPDRRPLRFDQNGGELIIHLPPKASDPLAAVLCLELP